MNRSSQFFPALHWNYRRLATVLLASIFVTSTALSQEPQPQDISPEQAKAEALEKDVTQGALRVVKEDGSVVECPLKHTDVLVDISGFVARVKVIQTFHNPLSEKIEAVYVFPLPHEAAVDDMTMVVGERRVVGLIKRRAEARQIYEQALAAGQTAALLEQERPNIFTQSVGNIDPEQEVKIEISYVDVLRYDVGSYEFQFPMVVGPRYIPGNAISTPASTPPELQGKVSPPVVDTTRVPDASRISPPVLKPEFRNGHDVAVSIKLDAGVPVQDLTVANHKASIQRDDERHASIVLDPADSIPNKDFVLRYDVTGAKPELAVLAHTGNYTDSRRLGNGYFMLMVQPKEDERLTKSPPREIVFLVDVSGSMSGEPTAKVIDAMQNMLKLCRPQDSIQVVTFAGQANKLFERPVPVNEANINTALNFTSGFQGSGGTEMLKGVQMAMDEPIDNEKLRIIVMLTDGYIGNEAEIIEHVGKKCGDQIRFWCIGIGSSPNMLLVDGVAKQGGGMGKQLGLLDDTTALTQEVMTRIQRAQLSKIQIDWGSLQVAETYPARIPELWAGRPVILFGRYTSGGDTTITVRGSVEGEEVRWPLAVSFPAQQGEHGVLAKIWARRKIEDLMQQTFYHGSPAVEEEVTAIALDYKLMSQYTSFVAVDESDVASQQSAAMPPRRMLVPVPLPHGTRWEGFFGPRGEAEGRQLEDKLSLGVHGVRDGAVAYSYFGVGRESNNRFYYRAGPARPALAGASLSAPLADTKRLAEFAKQPMSRLSRRGGLQRGRLAALQPVTRASLALESLDKYENGDGQGPSVNESIIALQGETLSKTAQEAFQTAQKAKTDKQRDAARLAFEHAYFLDTVATNAGYSSGEVAAQSLEALTKLRDEQVHSWMKSTPALQKKLDVVLRDKSIAEALDQIARAADIKIRLVEGSIEDAATLVSRDGVRVEYLDLTGATVRQALDWILQPASLTWQIEGKKVVAGSERRLANTSTWIYDVSLIALPDLATFIERGEHAQAQAEAQKAADEFLTVTRQKLSPKTESSIVWYGAGQLLITGDKELHERAAKFFADLADPTKQFKGTAGELHATTTKRATDRKEKMIAQDAATHRAFIASKHTEYGWQLLAAAAAAELDDEALTHLQIAWNDAATAEILKGEGAGIVLRSLWILREAQAVLDDDSGQLSELWKFAYAQSRPSISDALAALEQKPDDATTYLNGLYAALAAREEQEIVSQALPLLTKQRGSDSPLAPAAVLAQVLLGQSPPADHTAIEAIVKNGVQGDDLIVLTALACHRTGGQLRSLLLSESATLLGNQPLTGEVVVLVNRLSGSPLVDQ